MQWYYSSAERQLGPVSVGEMQNQARLGFIQPDTLIWRAGMATWQPASQVAEIQFQFGPPPLSSGSLSPSFPTPSGPPVSSTGPLVASIFTTLFCCLPFGIPGIVYAAKIGGKNANGDHQGAKEAAKMSYVWSAIAFGFGFIMVGLWAAMAVPAFNRVRSQARQTALIQDGRVLGNCAQQYFLTTGKTTVSFGYDSVSGEITGELTPWADRIGKGYTIHDNTIESGKTDAFSLSFPGAFGGEPVIFSDEGRTTRRSY